MSSDIQYITLQCFLNQNMPNIEFCTESMREKDSRGIANRGLCKHCMQPPEWLPFSTGVCPVSLLCWGFLQGPCRQLLVKIVYSIMLVSSSIKFEFYKFLFGWDYFISTCHLHRLSIPKYETVLHMYLSTLSM